MPTLLGPHMEQEAMFELMRCVYSIYMAVLAAKMDKHENKVGVHCLPRLCAPWGVVWPPIHEA